jgi:hypothetical protein
MPKVGVVKESNVGASPDSSPGGGDHKLQQPSLGVLPPGVLPSGVLPPGVLPSGVLPPSLGRSGVVFGPKG